jgi:hypothetical protein
LPNEADSFLIVTNAEGRSVQTFPRTDMLAAELDSVSATVAGVASEPQIGATGVDGASVTAIAEALIKSISSRRVVQVDRIDG